MSPLGAHGSYSNVAALSPAGAIRWYDQIHSGSGYAAAMDVERRIGEFFTGHIAPLLAAGLSNPALDKFLAAVGGWSDAGTRVRWPMSFATEEQVGAARPTARALLPELFPRGLVTSGTPYTAPGRVPGLVCLGAEGAIPPRNLSGPWTGCRRRL
jgi:dihydrodipicolinate synthase/N-acetylneuraminate lyase